MWFAVILMIFLDVSFGSNAWLCSWLHALFHDAVSVWFSLNT